MAAAVSWLMIQVGCGGGTGPTGTIAGKVTKGGAPVPNVNVAFIGPQGAASAVTDAAGEFRVPNPTPVGDYRASVTKPAYAQIDTDSAEYEAIMSGQAEEPAVADDATVPTKYRSTATSGLEYQIIQGENIINIELE